MKKKKRKNLTSNVSNIYISIAVFFILGFVFFGTSKIFLAENIPLNQTELNVEYDLRSNGKFMINDWIYDEKNHQMEVILVTNGIKSYTSELDFIAVPRSNVRSQLETKVVYNENDIYIIHIKNIPNEFQQMALRLTKTEIDYSELFDEKKDDESENESSVISTIYTDQRVVKKGTVEKKDFKKYASLITDSMIKSAENDIKKINDKIKKIDEIIATINNEIEKLKEEILYQTLDEQIDTNNQIFKLEQEIKGYEREKKTGNENIKSLEEKIEKLRQRKRDLDI